ncbi:predicted protein [Sclerotinia sclerotiorum 1980 UF-70]|uniref:Uncharacterized protein n=1 Tax=Sclerotinia sclerotiorum (strain ATCC 18683 / 1980 / Ss-1) TaxID=665079 RepID=A7EC87_SCLS1|nr:predicted protein [Sclerotinia sclerotiorum 1980 UF-70]EDO00066.1 predicted protein [Sclerotinia sclerotiorum 1980 UF-70]
MKYGALSHEFGGVDPSLDPRKNGKTSIFLAVTVPFEHRNVILVRKVQTHDHDPGLGRSIAPGINNRIYYIILTSS